MYVLITYDVCTITTAGAKRLRNVARICKNYGQRVQNSVFECLVDASQFVSLKQELLRIIDPDEDCLRIYQLGKNFRAHIECFGRKTSYEVEGTLMI
jgi:CRISPR-associated endoribonuclease cas2